MKTTLAKVWGYPMSSTQILHLWNNIFRVNLIRLFQRLQKEPKKGLMMIIQMCNCHTIGIKTPTTIIVKSSLLVVWTCDSEISLFHISWDICLILATFLTSKWWDINSQAAVSENAFCAFCFSPSRLQWWMVHSSLGTMEHYSSDLRDGTNWREEIPLPAPIFDKINKLCIQY